jgi:hypothetical protein
MYLSTVKYASQEINEKLTQILSIYNHIDYGSHERHDYCIFDSRGNDGWGDGTCGPGEPVWFLAGRRSVIWFQACEAELAGSVPPLFPYVDCHRNEAVIVWGTVRAPLTNT